MLQSPVRTIRHLVGLGVLLLLVAGCGGDGTEEASEWTVEEDALTLERNLFAGDDEDYFFGEIGGFAVRDDGRIYVADEGASHVKVLGPEGALQDSIGREGEGPGEFERPDQLFLARADSLYVVDGYRSELSVFTPDHSFAYHVSLRAGRSFPGRVMPMQERPGYLASYSLPVLPGGDEKREDRAVRKVAASGGAGDTLFTYSPHQGHIEQGSNYVRFRSIPFARAPHVVAGPRGHVHYAWSDSLGVSVYDMDGKLHRTIDIPFESVPVTEADRERELSGQSAESRAAVEDKIPSTKPAFDDFLVDDEGRYWFGRPTADPDSTDWWVAWPEEKRVVTAMLPSEVDLEVVKDGRAYGETTTDAGAPVLVRYRVQVNP